MSVKSTIFMAVILALLGSLFYFKDKVSAPSDEDAGKVDLAKFTSDDVTAMELTANGKTTSFQKVDGVWYVTSPFHGLAARNDVEALLAPLGTLKSDRIVAENVAKAAFKQYGLEDARTRFVVHLKSRKQPVVVEMGDRTPNSVGWYLRVPDQDTVYLSGNTLAFVLSKSPEDWREKMPVSYDPDQVDRFTVDGPDVSLYVQKGKDGKWMLGKPGSAQRAGDGLEISKYLAQVKSVTIRKFYPDIKPTDPRCQPVYTFKAWPTGARDPLAFTVGREAPGEDGYFAVRGTTQPEVFLLPRSGLHTMVVDVSQLADHHLLAFAVDQVAGARINTKSGAAVAEKRGGTWSFTAPRPRNDELGKVTAMTYSLQQLKYDHKILDAGELAAARKTLGSPFARFVLTDDKKKTVAELTVGGKARDGHGRYVTAGKDVFEAPVPFADDWQTVITALKAPPAAASASPAAQGSPAASPSPVAKGSPAAPGGGGKSQ